MSEYPEIRDLAHLGVVITGRGYWLGYRLATWGWRTAAMAVDLFIIIVAIRITTAIPIIWLRWPVGFLLIGLALLFYIVQPTEPRAPQTLGMMLFKMHMVRPTLDPQSGEQEWAVITPQASVVRALLQMTFDVWLFGWLRPLWNEGRQSWADKFTGTVVVRDPLFMQREQIREMQGILEAR